MTTAYIGLGSNLGNRWENLRRAVALLGHDVSVAAVSAVYETAPVGYADQGPFLNCAVAVETGLNPLELFDVMQKVERAMGKATPFRNGPRIIDLDLLLYGDGTFSAPGLEVPHPRLHERGFVLVPLADIAPDVVHPVLGSRVADLLAGFSGVSDVERCAEAL